MLFRPQLARFLKNVIKKEEPIDVGEGKNVLFTSSTYARSTSELVPGPRYCKRAVGIGTLLPAVVN